MFYQRVSRPPGHGFIVQLGGGFQLRPLGFGDPKGEHYRLRFPLGQRGPATLVHVAPTHAATSPSSAAATRSEVLHSILVTPAAIAGDVRSVLCCRTKL